MIDRLDPIRSRAFCRIVRALRRSYAHWALFALLDAACMKLRRLGLSRQAFFDVWHVIGDQNFREIGCANCDQILGCTTRFRVEPALCRDCKRIPRAELERDYPEIDFSKMPALARLGPDERETAIDAQSDARRIYDAESGMDREIDYDSESAEYEDFHDRREIDGYRSRHKPGPGKLTDDEIRELVLAEFIGEAQPIV
jgi:hypothetical protein